MSSEAPDYPYPFANLYKWLSLFFLAAGLIIILLIYKDFGIIWDEPNHHSYGFGIVEYFARGMDISIFPVPEGTDFTMDNAFLLYGGLFDTIVALCVQIFGGDEFETRHLVSGLIGLFGIVGAWKLACLFGGYRAAILAAVLLALEPNYFGMMFNNPKDAPFAVGYIWTVYYLIYSLEHLPNISISTAIKLGLAVGWMTGIRVPGVLGIAYLGLIFVVYALLPVWFSKEASDEPRPEGWLRSLTITGMIVFVITYLIMLLCWPWSHLNPLLYPYEAYQAFSVYQFWNGMVLFDGDFIRASDLPSYYLPQYLLVKLPDVVLVTLVLGLGLGIYLLATRGTSMPKLHLSQHAFLLFFILFPPTYAIISGAIIYDTIRHFLFIIPVICVLCGIVINHLALLAERNQPRLAPAVLAVIVLSLLAQMWVNVRLHPHQYVYYNSFIGGLKGADGRYETDYWANSYKEAVESMLAYVEAAEPEEFKSTQYKVYICGPFFSGAHYLPDNFKIVMAPQQADFFVAFTRVNCHMTAPGDPIATVSRMGVLLSVVKDLRGIDEMGNEVN